MFNFIVRIELHNATWNDYDNLHNAMGARGFHRRITFGGTKTYQLPTAEYFLKAPWASSQVLEAAQSAVRASGKRGEILVTKAAEVIVDGLAVVN